MKKITAAVLVLTSLVAASAAFTQSFSVQMGQMKGPVQPINYSHRLHAGQMKMKCLYCHYGAEKSPWANIPAVSTCMGCHKIAATDKPEIIKLTGYYDRGEQPKWVKVHYLPDHVKFNHKRHVRAGFQCQECHGPIQDMDRVYQYNSLKMGWCISCHRKHMNDKAHPATMDCLACHH